MTPAEIKALDPLSALSRAQLPNDVLADALLEIQTDSLVLVGERNIHADNLLVMAATALRSFMDGGWRPIAEYEGCGPALVSTAPDSPRELFSEPASAFRDVTGIWRCLGSIGGYAELALQPTHFRALPKQPAEMCRDRR